MPFSKKSYSAYEKIESRRLKPEVAFAFLLLMMFVGGLGFVVYDISKSPETIDDSKNTAILGEVKAEKDSYQTLITDEYTIQLPEDWVNVNSPERIYEEGKRYYPDRFQGTTAESNGRFVEVFMRKIPNVPVDKIIDVTVDGDGLIVGDFSPQCIEYAEYDEDNYQRNAEVPAKWNDREFTCRLSSVGNTIAAVATSTKGGYVLSGETKDTRFLLVFADNGANEDNTIFRNILETFKAN